VTGSLFAINGEILSDLLSLITTSSSGLLFPSVWRFCTCWTTF